MGRLYPKTALLALLLTPFLHSQTLAHKNWAGSGLTVEPWFQGAVFYQIDPIGFQDSNADGFGDLRGIAARLPYLQQLGVDAIVLSPFPLQAPGTREPFDPAYGTPEDFDDLEQQAARLKIRIVVDLPLRSDDILLQQARFWLSRGVAGLRLVHDPDNSNPFTAAQRDASLRQLRPLLTKYGGQRALLWDAGDTGPELALRRGQSRPRPDLTADRRLTQVESLAALKPLLTGNPSTLVETDQPDRRRSFDRLGDLPQAKLLATALLAGRGVPLLYFGQELGMASTPANGAAGDPTPMQWGEPDGFTTGVPWIDMGRNAVIANVAAEDPDPASLLNWYRKLAALHHASAALRSGSFDLLTTTDPNLLVWVRKPRVAGLTNAPVLVVLNLANRPAVTSLGGLAPELHRAAVTGTLLRTLARTANEPTGTPMMSGISLEPYGVYLGEIRTGVGLEGIVLPVRSHRR